MKGRRMKLGGAVAMLLGLLGVTMQGPTAVPIAANAEYRLVPVARTQPDTTRWHVERRVMHDASGAWGLQVMIVTRAGRTSWDSVRFDPVTLALVWERSLGPPATVITVAGSRLEGRLGTAKGPRPFAAVASGPVFSSTMDDFVIQRLPLAEGSPRVLAFWDGSRLERDTVRVRESGAKGWVVDFAEPYAVETLWIDRASRGILRHTYRWRRDGTQSEVAED